MFLVLSFTGSAANWLFNLLFYAAMALLAVLAWRLIGWMKKKGVPRTVNVLLTTVLLLAVALVGTFALVRVVADGGMPVTEGSQPVDRYEWRGQIYDIYGDALPLTVEELVDVWRAAQVESRPGVTYSAYGEGEKPGLYGSVENGGSAEQWSLWYEGGDGRKIWVYHQPMLDCGAIYLAENLAAEKVQGFWKGECFQVFSALWYTDQGEAAAVDQAAQPVLDPAVHLTEDLTFFCQAGSGLPDTLPIYLLGWVDTGVRELLGDESGEIVTLSRSRWGEAAW